MGEAKSKASIDNRLLETAIEQFGRKGLEGASTRDIAAAAGTAMSSITYHYGGKEGLYLAAARYIAEQIEAGLSGALSESVAVRDATPEQALDGIYALTDAVLGLMLSSQSAAWSRFIVREQMEPSEAFEIIYRRIFDKAAGRLVELIKRVGKGRWNEEQARLKAVTILGQILVFRVAQATVGRITGWKKIDAERTAKIRQVVRANCRAILVSEDK